MSKYETLLSEISRASIQLMKDAHNLDFSRLSNDEFRRKSPGQQPPKNTLESLVNRAHGLLLLLTKETDDADQIVSILNEISYYPMIELFSFGRLHGPLLPEVINSLGVKLGGKVDELPGFKGSCSQFLNRPEAEIVLSEQGIILPLSPANEPLGLFSNGSALHYGMYNFLYRSCGSTLLSRAITQVIEGQAPESHLALSIGELTLLDPSSVTSIRDLVESQTMHLPHDRHPELRAALGLGNFSVSEVSFRIRKTLLGLGLRQKPKSTLFAAKTMFLHPNYRQEGLVDDMIDIALIHLMDETVSGAASIDANTFQGERLFAHDEFLRAAQLSQSEIDRIACRGVRSMTGGDWVQSKMSGTDHGIRALLDEHLRQESRQPGSDYTNRTLLLSLIRASEPDFLLSAAAKSEDHAVALYEITGRQELLQHVKKEVNRDKVFACDLGL